MWGVPFTPPGDQDVDASSRGEPHQKDLIKFASFHSLTRRRSRWGPKVASTFAALLAVAAVVFVVLRCDVRRLQGARTSAFGERMLASSDEEEESEPSIQGSPAVCEDVTGADEQQAQQPQGVALRPRSPPASPANAGGSQQPTRKRPGKTGETLKILAKLAKSSADFSEPSPSSSETSASPTSSISAEETSDSEEEPLTKKKKKSEESTPQETQTKEAKPSAPGEPSVASGGPGDDEDYEIPASLLDDYLQDTLQQAEHLHLASWLLDPEQDLPVVSVPSGKGEAYFPAKEEKKLEAPAPHEDVLPVLELADVIETLQEEPFQFPSPVPSTSSELPAHGAALLPPEAWPYAVEAPSTSGALAKLLTPDAAAPSQDSSSTAAGDSSQVSPSLEKHPFYRLPARRPQDPQLDPVDYDFYFDCSPSTSLPQALSEIRRILAQREVSTQDLQYLQTLGTHLMRYAGRYVNSQPPLETEYVPPMIRSLALRFLLGHYLLVVCNVVGPSMQKELWWNSQMDHALSLPAGWQPPKPKVRRASTHERFELIQMLLDALQRLRRGEMLPASLVVPIMKQLFCSAKTHRSFLKPDWDPWREAHQRFLEGSPEDSTSSDSDDDE
ncbi:hypothetical protein Emed_001536 [Eimeria media]